MFIKFPNFQKFHDFKIVKKFQNDKIFKKFKILIFK